MRTSEDGYTLVELVIVVALAGLLVIVALSGVSARNDTARFSAQMEDIKTAIRSAQTEAASGRGDAIPAGQRAFATMISFSPTSYTTYRVGSLGDIPAAEAKKASLQKLATVAAPDGLTFSFAASPAWVNYPNLGHSILFTTPNQRYPSAVAYTVLSADPTAYEPTNRSLRQSVDLTVTSRFGHQGTITYDAWGGRLSSEIAR